MTMSAATQLQEAIFAALNADAAIGFMLAGIYDEAPQEAAYPYLSMGESRFRNAGLKGTSGAEVNFDLIIWSNDPGQMQVKELMTAVETSLESAELTLSGHDLATLRLESATCVRQWNEAGSLYRGRLAYSALVYAA